MGSICHSRQGTTGDTRISYGWWFWSPHWGPDSGFLQMNTLSVIRWYQMMGRSKLNSHLLDSAWLSFGCFKHLGHELADRNFALFYHLYIYDISIYLSIYLLLSCISVSVLNLKFSWSLFSAYSSIHLFLSND